MNSPRRARILALTLCLAAPAIQTSPLEACDSRVRESWADSVRVWGIGFPAQLKLKSLDGSGVDHEAWIQAFTTWMVKSDLDGTGISRGTAHILTVSLYYPSDTWTGHTERVESWTKQSVSKVQLFLNLDRVSSEPSRWGEKLKVAFHEMGHAFTLGHVCPDGEDGTSVMVQGTRSCSQWDCPTPADLAAVNRRRRDGYLP